MLTLAIAGLGTVGASVVRQLRQNADLIALRAGQPIKIKAVCALAKPSDCDLSGTEWVDDPRKLASLPGVDVVVELMGGVRPAKDIVMEFLNRVHIKDSAKVFGESSGMFVAA